MQGIPDPIEALSLETEIDVRRLLWLGPAAVAASIAAVSIVRRLLRWLMPVESWSGSIMASIEPEIVTAVLVVGAVMVFPIVADCARQPIRSYRRIAFAVLLVSCIPNVAVPISAGKLVDAGMLQLMFLHVVAWAVSTTMLTRLSGRRIQAPSAV